ncbi:hypothetical protein N9A99_02835, partial [Akkermansiaceae bacterium]|nr:hypothetical protein [Akkermansiaceae bacterium]
MVRTSYSVLLAFVLLTLACEFSKAEDKPVEYDRTAVLATLDEAASTTEDPEVKRALKKMSECVERGNKLLVLSGLRALPPEIGQLTNLTGLTLHDNQLTALPPEICQLTKLAYLGLKRNQFTTVPPEIFELTSLKHLDLGENQLTTLPPKIGQLTTLTQLSFNGNGLSTLPPEIGKLTNLTHLRLWDNQLST